MAWGKGKTEKGQGGKLGHSNRDGWGFHDEEKTASKKQRRLDQKQLIITETSIVHSNIISNVNEVLELLHKHDVRYEFDEFDSGAVMIHFWKESDMYCIQMVDSKFGWTNLTEDVGFCTIPESGYLDWSIFKTQLHKIVGE